MSKITQGDNTQQDFLHQKRNNQESKYNNIFDSFIFKTYCQLQLIGMRKIQSTSMPPIDASFVDTRMEQLLEYTEENREVRVQWCQGLVVTVKEKKSGKHKVRIKWSAAYVREGGGYPAVIEETLLKTYWNKHRIKGWRLDLTS